MAGKKQVKVGVKQGGGPPPGYQWTVLVLNRAKVEIENAFNDCQYQHLVHQVKELAQQESPSHSPVHSIDAIEDFHELREKGGVLNAVNARIFFGIDHTTNSIVILGGIRKQNNGQRRSALKKQCGGVGDCIAKETTGNRRRSNERNKHSQPNANGCRHGIGRTERQDQPASTRGSRRLVRSGERAV